MLSLIVPPKDMVKVCKWILEGGKRPFNKDYTAFLLDRFEDLIKLALKDLK